MPNKSKNKRVEIGLMIVAICTVVAGLWAVLETPETALAKPPDKPGRNVVQQDIPAILTFDAGGLSSDGGPYNDLENGTSCAVGRRRSIWVDLGNNSPRRMNLTLGVPLTAVESDPEIGCDPLGDPTGIDPPELPSGAISQVNLHIGHFLNVSGLGDEYLGEDFPYCEDIEGYGDGYNNNTMSATMDLLFFDELGEQWGLYFGPGRDADGDWGGGRHLTNKLGTQTAPPVKIQRTNPGENPKRWIVKPHITQRAEGAVVPGFLWYKKSKKNAPWSFVGVFDVPWSCIDPGNVKSLE